MTAKEALEKLKEKYGAKKTYFTSYDKNNRSVEMKSLTDEYIYFKPIETALDRLEEIEQVAIKGFNPNIDDYEYGQLFYSKENGYELKNKNGDLLTNEMIQKANDDYFKMKNVLKIIKEKRVNVRAFLKCCHSEDGLKIYNNQCDDKDEKGSKELTEAEFDIVMEALK